MQFAVSESRKVENVQEPAGKGLALGAADEDGEAGLELWREYQQLQIWGISKICVEQTYLFDCLCKPTASPTARATMHIIIKNANKHILPQPPLLATYALSLKS